MKDLVIGLDAGTSVIKSVAFDLSGKQLAVNAIPNQYENVSGGGAEQDMARTWRDAAATLKGLSEQIPDIASRTAAVAVTGQGDGTWLVSATGEPVAPAWLWLDARAAAIVDEFNGTDNAGIRFANTGTGLAACQQGAQLLWMKQYAPELIGASAAAMHCKDWLYLKLTGEFATDPSEACFTFGNFRTREYSDDAIAALGLTDCRRLLPSIVDGVEQNAVLSQQAAALTGLLGGTPIVLGYVDVVCTALGAGLYDPASTPGCTIVGTTGIHMRLVDSAAKVVLNEARTGFTMPLPVPDMYAQMQSNMSSTMNIDWLLDVATDLVASLGVSHSRADLIPMLDGWVEQAVPAAMLYQPYVSEAGERGPFIDANARAGFTGISTQHRFPDLMRAVFEGIACAARDCYNAMGPMPTEVRITGGAARSQVLRTIIASTLNASTRTSTREEAGAAGAAMMATVAVGHYQHMDDCVGDWVNPLVGGLESPDPDLVEIYKHSFSDYVKTHKALRPVWHGMAQRRNEAGPEL